jgi:transcriptional regulator with XRE-family HTH domain
MASPLASFRSRYGLTQREAADQIGIGLSTWRQIESGFRGRRPPAWLLNHLAALDAIGSFNRAFERQMHRPCPIPLAWPVPIKYEPERSNPCQQ